jgi:hypothetical protein
MRPLFIILLVYLAVIVLVFLMFRQNKGSPLEQLKNPSLSKTPN